MSDYIHIEKLQYVSEELIGKNINLSGWVYGVRVQGDTMIFLDVTDGTLRTDPIRAVVFKEEYTVQFGSTGSEEMSKKSSKEGSLLTFNDLSDGSVLSRACSVELNGTVIKAPEKATQDFEVRVHSVRLIGSIEDPETYPIQKSNAKNTISLRKYPHERFRAKLTQAFMWIRDEAQFAVAEFFKKHGVPKINPNIFTSSDCEGAGEMFIVEPQYFNTDGAKVGATVSSQLALEAIARGFNAVYTHQKSFRAEKSDTSKHLSEFEHVEYERYFIDFEQLLSFTEGFLKHVIKVVLDRAKDQYMVLNDKRYAPAEYKNHSVFLGDLLEKPFVRITHRDAIDLMLQDLRDKAKHTGPSGKEVRLKFKVKPAHGEDLASEHEKYLVEKFGTFVFVTHWPSKIKSFYMKQCGDGTCEAFDLLAPHVGELFGGSMREFRYDVLKDIMESCGMDMRPSEWYLNIRKSGTAPHGGWGMGFDRLVMLLTGAPSIRDVVPYPVYFGHCPY